MRLVAVARCFDTQVEVVGVGVFDKSSIAVFIGLLDFAAVLVFLLAVCWLRRSERREVRPVPAVRGHTVLWLC